ncbi:hypothetical protein N3K66_006136 [Trichothecium roseum]|uniref:Uncharacterized protein n=1 Tax=Trichothecium roseum TaxID=47278 RepID=A0ACC0V2I5_9HYPO|nr:hypothetical protein N3K66_006136 [Trichothecium roseum]
MSLLLPPHEPPSNRVLNTVHGIDFRHPAYPESEQPLLRLRGVDGASQGGVDYHTALIACGIITDNTWPEGWLAVKNGDGSFSAIDRPDDGILRDMKYFYFVGQHEPTFKYPIIPSFDHWRFPHNNLPDLWGQVIIPAGPRVSGVENQTAALVRDNTCRISGYGNAIDATHFIPFSARYWFNSNDMTRYCSEESEPHPIDDKCNLVALRKDLHFLFDQRRFTFVPKYAIGDAEPQLVIHVLSPKTSTELIDLYHNRIPQVLTGISIEMVFARFAWSIFADERMPFFRGATANRSVSSRKRNRDHAAEYEATPDGSVVSETSSSDLDYFDPFHDAEEETRGRQRNRSWCRHNVESPPDLVDPCSSGGFGGTSGYLSDTAGGVDLSKQTTDIVTSKRHAEHIHGGEEIFDGGPRKRVNLGYEEGVFLHGHC